MILTGESESPDQTAHLCSLIWAFTIRTSPEGTFFLGMIVIINILKINSYIPPGKAYFLEPKNTSFLFFHGKHNVMVLIFFLIFPWKYMLLVLIMPPTSKKLEGHIASGTFVRACVRLSVCQCIRPLHFLMHSITSEPCMLGFWNFIKILHEKIADLYFFSIRIMPLSWVMALWKKYGWILVNKIWQKLLKLEPWNLVNRLVLMSRWPH